jgi:hypothetical protein
MNDETAKVLTSLAMSFYADEPCRICGETIQDEDLPSLVFAGYAQGGARAAHEGCWNSRKDDKEGWAYPVDAARE